MKVHPVVQLLAFHKVMNKIIRNNKEENVIVSEVIEKYEEEINEGMRKWFSCYYGNSE